jgi:hypothetical protein
MREAIVILLVIAVLLALTAIKYRRQIVTLIGFYKQVQAIRSGLKSDGVPQGQRPLDGIQLIKCDHCGKWVVPDRSTRSAGKVICGDCVSNVKV